MIQKLILKGLYYSGAQKLLGPMSRGKGSILMLHRVHPGKFKRFGPNRHLSVTPRFLEKVIVSLKRKGFEFISMDDVAERLADPAAFTGRKPFLSVTLDDGYRDNLEFAVPIFRKHEVPFTIYIAPGLVEATTTLWWEDIENVLANRSHIFAELPRGRTDFDIGSVAQKRAVFEHLTHELLFVESEEDQRSVTRQLCRDYDFDQTAHVRNLIMEWTDINSLARDPLCSIGAHTVGHHALSKLTEKDVRFEMEQSRKIIKTETGQDPVHFAYPYGHEKLAAVREFKIAEELGYTTAVTTRHGVIYQKHAEHMFALPRISLNGRFQSMDYVKSLVSGIPTLLVNRGGRLNVGDPN